MTLIDLHQCLNMNSCSFLQTTGVANDCEDIFLSSLHMINLAL